MSIKKGSYIYGVFDNEETLMHSIEPLKKEGLNIYEVYTPYPIHGLDEELGYKRSRIDIAAFMFGITGTTCALTMLIGMLTLDWPMIIGGKSTLPLPDFIPITFELTVLFASLGMVASFLVVSGYGPWVTSPTMFDIRSTNDKFIMALSISRNHDFTESDLESHLKSNGAIETHKKEI